MQEVSDEYIANTKKITRQVSKKVEVDWELSGGFSDETHWVQTLEFTRSAEEPLGGIATSVAAVRFVNNDNRYTPTN